MLSWAIRRKHTISSTRLYSGEEPPSVDQFDWLVVMGGPMGAGDADRFPWLTVEKQCIQQSIASGKFVLGICLGAQLIAAVLGGSVFRNEHREIGWHPVRLTSEARESALFSALPNEFAAFHWHGDMFAIPDGCVRMAGSDACANQAFQYRGRVFAIQFHLESTEENVRSLITCCPEDLRPGLYVQSAGEILSKTENIPSLNILMENFLDRIAGTAVNNAGFC